MDNMVIMPTPLADSAAPESWLSVAEAAEPVSEAVPVEPDSSDFDPPLTRAESLSSSVK